MESLRHRLGAGNVRLCSFEMSLAAGCNAHCRYCSSWKQAEDFLPFALGRAFLDYLRSAVDGAFLVNMVGGEPTTHPQILDLVQHARDLGITPLLTTNGYRLSEPTFVERFCATGTRRVVLSWDGFQGDHDHQRGKGAFDRVFRAYRLLRGADRAFAIGVQAVITQRNAAKLPDFAKWLFEELGVTSLTLQALTQDLAQEPFPDWYMKNPLWPKDAEAMETVDAALDGLVVLKRRGLPIMTSEEQLHFWKKYFRNPRQFSTTGRCTIGDFHLGISHRGDLVFCPFKKPVGNLHDKDAAEIVSGSVATLRRLEINRCDVVCNYLVNCRHDLLRASAETRRVTR